MPKKNYFCPYSIRGLRYFLEIAYDGTHYHGWQEQRNARGIQEVIADALSLLLKSRIPITGSGRTDTGVHALQQVAHIDLPEPVDTDHLLHRLNRFLPGDIAIHRIYRVKDDAHARYSATARTYEYRITGIKDPFLAGRAWYLRTPPDLPLMNEASAMLLDYKDFEAFSRVKTDVKNFRCDLSYARWIPDGPLYRFNIRSDRFLRGMVRTLVGTLVDLSFGKISLDQFRKIIVRKDRRQAGPAAPAHGLYLLKVEYPVDLLVKL